MSDQQLLREYAQGHEEPAFAELVRRHINLVYSAALRMVRDAHLAEDVTQRTFAALAQNASQLANRPVLSGWLHRTAQNLAAKTVRSEVRRRTREQEAATMNELFSPDSNAIWEQIAPHLDAALGELNESDRDAVLLRYFERKSAIEMAERLGISSEAAQKRVNRAVEHLREFLAKRGVTVGAGGLVLLISANAAHSAPVGLAVTISTATLAGTAIASSTTATFTKAIVMTTLQKTLIAAAIAAAVGSGIYEMHQASMLKDQVQTLQQQAPLAEQLKALLADNNRLSNQVVAARNSQALSKGQLNELLKLRSKAGHAQSDSRELARLKSTLAQQNGKIPDGLTNAMSIGIKSAEKWKMKDAQERVARMQKMLNLTEDQAQAISEILQKHIQKHSEMTLGLITGKLAPDQLQAMGADTLHQETEIKALLSPDQLAAYPSFLQAEAVTAADTSARSDASEITDDFSLSKEQQSQIQAAFYQMNLSDATNGVNRLAITAAKNNGNMAEAANMNAEFAKSELEEKLKILGNFLTPAQLNTYRQEQMNKINMQEAAMKMFTPQAAAGNAN